MQSNHSSVSAESPIGDHCGSAIVISADWPGDSGGARLCTRSDLQAATQTFRQVYFVYVGPPLDDLDKLTDRLPPDVEAISLARSVPRPALSLLASLASPLPALVHRYRRIGQELERTLDRIGLEIGDERLSVIFEDVPPAVLAPRVRQRLPNARIAIRSHNLISQAFVGMTRHARIPMFPAWWLEQRKIRAFETNACRRDADRIWAISRSEAEAYRDFLGVPVDGVLGVGLEQSGYRKVPFGDPNVVVHIGRMDLRKGKAMEEFLRYAWPRVRMGRSEARILIAGRGSERLTDPHAGVEGLGVVENDADFLGRGGIFANPQAIGAGIQIKSAVALLAGKALVSTPMAAEGLEGREGEHFEVAEKPETAAEKILRLINDEEGARLMGKKGRELASKEFDRKRVESQAAHLMRDLAELR